jgi:hypothetical protein
MDQLGRNRLSSTNHPLEDPDDLVVAAGGAGCPAGEQVTDQHLEVAPSGGLQAGATAAEEVVALPHGDE